MYSPLFKFHSPGDYNRFRRKGGKGDLIPRMLGVRLSFFQWVISNSLHISIAEIENNKVLRRGRRSCCRERIHPLALLSPPLGRYIVD